MNVQSALEKNVIKLNFMEYPLEYGRDVKCDCEFLMKSSFISSSLFAFAIFTHFQRNDGCIHLANVCDCFWDFPMNGLVCGCMGQLTLSMVGTIQWLQVTATKSLIEVI